MRDRKTSIPGRWMSGLPRVVNKIGPVSYIHANYVSTPINPKRFICTQQLCLVDLMRNPSILLSLIACCPHYSADCRITAVKIVGPIHGSKSRTTFSCFGGDLSMNFAWMSKAQLALQLGVDGADSAKI
ncbi:hypothetical protein KIN20_035654 [Parelaphostrongylus tenuis]|uniref:Uncharacterized protein n=1 Tax=Parelaphostrongylus tenuis TaxID=148309 RepID=A0AAD5RC43_PARTN|nr:hypothetical protein KIN20_011508 [Parelaphostrongylus tenuis]KAJ1373293.1 hypothetical protein KIN20_035654 [Parelaphostrongylus tenuis]